MEIVISEIRPLHESDDRSKFCCGDVDLDGFFRKYSGQNQFRHHIGVTYVAIASASNKIVGYATVAAGNLEVDGITALRQKRLPKYPVPILRLARLATDVSVQGQGVGKQLLHFLFELAMRMASEVKPKPVPMFIPINQIRASL